MKLGNLFVKKYLVAIVCSCFLMVLAGCSKEPDSYVKKNVEVSSIYQDLSVDSIKKSNVENIETIYTEFREKYRYDRDKKIFILKAEADDNKVDENSEIKDQVTYIDDEAYNLGDYNLTANAYFRSSPQIQEDTIIELLDAGTEVELIDLEEVEDLVWAKVKYDDQEGYIAFDYLELNEDGE